MKKKILYTITVVFLLLYTCVFGQKTNDTDRSISIVTDSVTRNQVEQKLEKGKECIGKYRDTINKEIGTLYTRLDSLQNVERDTKFTLRKEQMEEFQKNKEKYKTAQEKRKRIMEIRNTVEKSPELDDVKKEIGIVQKEINDKIEKIIGNDKECMEFF